MQIKKHNNRIVTLLLAVAFSVTAFLVPLNVQAVQLDQQFINQNRSYKYLEPQGIVIHDTCAPGGTAQNNHDYFNRVYVASSAHYFADWTKVIQCVPNNEQAWHAGPYANRRYLSIEMCNPGWHNQEQFDSVYKNTVELAAQLCKQYGWNTNNIVSHAYISNTYHETDHEDPIFFLQSYGKTWDMLLNDIQRAINGQSASTVIPQSPLPITSSWTSRLQTECNNQGFSHQIVDGIPGNNTLNGCPMLKKGDSSNITYLLQEKLGVSADGVFGNQTRQAVVNFQRAHGLAADGIVGKNTWRVLLGL